MRGPRLLRKHGAPFDQDDIGARLGWAISFGARNREQEIATMCPGRPYLLGGGTSLSAALQSISSVSRGM